MLGLMCAIPALGVFRLDLASASFVIFGHVVWWDNFLFLAGLALALLAAPLLTYVTVGSLWCGWACPQNLLTEWADALTFQWLGKRADVRVDGEGMVVAPHKNRLNNWFFLGFRLFALSLILGVTVFSLFYSPGEVWGFILGTHPRQANMAIMLAFTVLLVFIDIAVIRHFFCDYACFYRMGQRLFQTSDALHIVYEAPRASACTKCHYCSTVCPVHIQPNRIQPHDVCIDCGECVDACDRLQKKNGQSGLLTFSKSIPAAAASAQKPLFGSHLGLFRLGVAAVFVLGCGLMAWGIMTQKNIDDGKLQAEQDRMLRISHVCTPRCSALRAACGSANMAACYQAAGCTCQCSLDQDPTNELHDTWQQCVTLNAKHLHEWESRVSAAGRAP